MGHKLETELKGSLVPQCFLRLCLTYMQEQCVVQLCLGHTMGIYNTELGQRSTWYKLDGWSLRLAPPPVVLTPMKAIT